MWCEKPSNCQLEYTQHGGLTCKSTRRTRRPARLQPACSARRPERRCVVCTRVACHHPSMVCHWERPNRCGSVGTSGVEIGPFSASGSGSLAGTRNPQGDRVHAGRTLGSGIPPIRNWQHEMYHLLSLKMKERVGPKSPLIS